MKQKQFITLLCTGGFLLLFALWGLAAPDESQSLSERRPLAQRPAMTPESVTQGQFMSQWEDYLLDQFPLRDSFRGLKTWVSFHLLGQKSVNGLYRVGQSIAKLDYPLNTSSLDHAAGRFRYVYDRYLGESKVYFSIIPDKNYFLAQAAGVPAMDYAALEQQLRASLDFAEYLEIAPHLSADAYYNTDPHWRQESLWPVAQTLAQGMGTALTDDLLPQTRQGGFLGSYAGQLALGTKEEDITWFTGPTLEECTLYDYETGQYIPIFDQAQLDGPDPYSSYLGGSKSLLRLENPTAQTDRELILFRDSFGSSLAPLLASGYRAVTLVDIRYLSPALLDRWLDFQGKDVLFLYSASVLNNSVTLK